MQRFSTLRTSSGSCSFVTSFALEKIAADPDPLEVANKATAHLYINNPLREHKSWLNNMFTTHPPIEERVKLLRAM